MKCKVVLAMVTVIGSLALSATAAQAFGSGPFALTSFFVCQGISGDDPGKEVTVGSSILLTNPQNARIGNGTLACVVAKLFDAITGNEIDPNPSGAANDGLKCYSVSVSRQKSNLAPPFRWDVSDQLFPNGTEFNVPASSFQYICSPANFTNPH